MKKDVAGQKIGAQLVSATDGSAFTGSVTVAVTGDAGTQATGSVGSGACTHEGGGYHTYAPAQAETNYDLVAFTFSGTGAVPVTIQIYTRPTTGLLAPTVANRTLDVSAGGEAGIDWANVGSPTTTLALTGTTVSSTQKVDVETIKTNPVVNAGTVTFPTTATLASTTNITAAAGVVLSGVTHTGAVIPTVSAVTGLTAANLDAAISTRATPAQVATELATYDAPTNTEMVAAFTQIKGATWAVTDTLEAIRDRGDAAWTTATGFATPTNITAATGITVSAIGNDVITAAAIANGAIDAATFAADVDAEILSYIVDDATRIDASSLNTAAVTSIPAILADTGTDGVVVNAASVATAVWNAATASYGTAGTYGESLEAVGASADPWLTNLPGAYGAGTAGKIIGDNLNATVSSRASQASVDDIPTNAELATALGTADDATLAAIAAEAIKTAAIQAKTDLIPASPASTTNITAGTITTVTNLTNAPTTGDLTATMKASVNTEVLDVLNVDTFAELSAPPAATSSLRAKLTWLFMWARNKATATATQRKLYADDGTTVVSTEALSDDATTYTKGEAS